MEEPSVHNQRVLREKAYFDDTHLDVRYRTHQIYTVDPVDFGRWTLERLVWRGNEHVLDMGCARGDLLREMARQHEGWGLLAGFDLSAGMIVQAVELAAGLPVSFFTGDAQALPFPDALFDVVIARHMLYHVPDIERAVAEAARMLRQPQPSGENPGGSFLVTTNSADSMPEYHALWERAADRFASVARPADSADRFSLENAAAFLETHFERIEMHTLPGTLRFPAAQPFVDYFASTRALTMRPDHTEVEWQAVLDFLRVETEAVIARQGCFDVTKVAAAIVGFKGG